MKRYDAILDERATVHWEDTVPVTLLVQFHVRNKPKPVTFKSISSYILQALKENEYENIFMFLKEVQPSEELLQQLINEQGHVFLKYALTYSRDTKVFGFVENFFSRSDIHSILQKEDHYTLKQFMFSQFGAEIATRDLEEYRDVRVKKFKFLLVIAEDVFTQFMDNSVNQPYITLKITEDYMKAKKEFQEDNQAKVILRAEL